MISGILISIKRSQLSLVLMQHLETLREKMISRRGTQALA